MTHPAARGKMWFYWRLQKKGKPYFRMFCVDGSHAGLPNPHECPDIAFSNRVGCIFHERHINHQVFFLPIQPQLVV